MTQDSPLSRLIGGRYQLEHRIARGGMAEVWLASDTFLHRQVAVKLLKPHLANDENVAERFRREAVACAGISHPNIVAVYDCIEHGGRQAVIMQYVEGKSLREVLDKQKKLQPQLTIHIGLAVAAALEEAHKQNFVHRDVKPGNILMTKDARCLLADFGIAKALVSSGDDLTNDNIMMGTAKYLSPEQVRGKPLDGRADLYGLGLVLYECLAGRVPFIGESDADTALARLQREPTDLARLRPSVSPNLVKVIHKLLARNPDHRYATAADTIVALRAARSGELDRTTEITPPSGLMVVGGEMLDERFDRNRERESSRDRSVRTVSPTLSRNSVVGQPLLAVPDRERQSSSSPTSATSPFHQRSSSASRHIITGLAVAGLIGAGLIGAGFVGDSALWFTNKESPTAESVVVPVAPAVTESASIVSIMSYDPNGDDGEENEALVPLLLDSNPQTNWATTCYFNQYFGSKEFVGIIIQLSAPTTGTLNVYLGNAPWKMDVYTALDSAPAQLAGWGQRIATDNNVKLRKANFVLTQPAQFVLIALREIGKSEMCSGSNPYQGLLSGVTFQAS
ncbi:MAG: serine/threonine protein kinase [Actinobacteria bacterium]|nr:MAG: serine/threonine protein kinase [Actinomycetota bacterium]